MEREKEGTELHGVAPSAVVMRPWQITKGMWPLKKNGSPSLVEKVLWKSKLPAPFCKFVTGPLVRFLSGIRAQSTVAAILFNMKTQPPI